MGSDDSKAAKTGVTAWFLRNFFGSPATWVGLSSGAAVGYALLDKGPIGGAIGLGSMVAVAAGVVCYGLVRGVRALHRTATTSTSDVELAAQSSVPGIVESLRAVGQAEEADLLEKMAADRDAIEHRCRELAEAAPGGEDALHTMELASAVVDQSCRQAEELQDLVRRCEDPLLESPADAEAAIGRIRAELRQAYQAVADSRSRLRRGEKIDSGQIDFLAASGSFAQFDLSALTRKLAEETAISRRVEERLRPAADVAGWMEDEESPEGSTSWDSSGQSESERPSESE